jgi:2,3-bisphosphoglycerate-independent phosphoglycerate mutase
VCGRYNFVLLHVKAVDDTGHDRMAAMKVGGLLS